MNWSIHQRTSLKSFLNPSAYACLFLFFFYQSINDDDFTYLYEYFFQEFDAFVFLCLF